MKLQLLSLAAALLLAFPGGLAVEGNHTRWNDQVNACVYFYKADENTSAHCYVAPDYCVRSPEKPDTYQTIELTACIQRVSIATGTVTFTIVKPNQPPLFKLPA
jgi:hypothetical protein